MQLPQFASKSPINLIQECLMETHKSIQHTHLVNKSFFRPSLQLLQKDTSFAFHRFSSSIHFSLILGTFRLQLKLKRIDCKIFQLGPKGAIKYINLVSYFQFSASFCTLSSFLLHLHYLLLPALSGGIRQNKSRYHIFECFFPHFRWTTN